MGARVCARNAIGPCTSNSGCYLRNMSNTVTGHEAFGSLPEGIYFTLPSGHTVVRRGNMLQYTTPEGESGWSYPELLEPLWFDLTPYTGGWV